jgi:hypothetical protein
MIKDVIALISPADQHLAEDVSFSELHSVSVAQSRSRNLDRLVRPARAFRWRCKASDFEDYLLNGHRLLMGFAGSAVISIAAQ